MNKVIRQQFAVYYEYPVVFTRDVFDPGNPALRDVLVSALKLHPSPSMLICIEEAVAAATPSLAGKVTAYLNKHAPALHLSLPPLILRGGEGIKSDRAAVEHLARQMTEARLDRHSYVMAIGGGALLDAVGYVASLVHRGVRMIRLPTTVLSQNDGGVGVKTAINDPAGKNFLGTFAPPFAVISDFDFLNTLPDEEWRGGIAEAFKVAMIKDAAFFDWLCAHAGQLAARDEAAMEALVIRCAELHLLHIRSSGDPFEMGQARPLDFGHWSAHQVEAMTDYAVGHGPAVAIGIMLDALYAARKGWLDAGEAGRLFDGLVQSGFVLWHEAMERRDPSGRRQLMGGLEKFREHLGGPLCVTMPAGTGAAMEVSSMDEALLESVISDLHDRVAGRPSSSP